MAAARKASKKTAKTGKTVRKKAAKKVTKKAAKKVSKKVTRKTAKKTAVRSVASREKSPRSRRTTEISENAGIPAVPTDDEAAVVHTDFPSPEPSPQESFEEPSKEESFLVHTEPVIEPREEPRPVPPVSYDTPSQGSRNRLFLYVGLGVLVLILIWFFYGSLSGSVKTKEPVSPVQEESEVRRETPSESEPTSVPVENEEGGGRVYVVQPGDTLSEIAERQLGSASRWLEIYEKNRDRIEDIHQIYENQELQLPTL